jgi:hypothetical protein
MPSTDIIFFLLSERKCRSTLTSLPGRVCVCVCKKEKENEKNKEILLAFKDEMMGEFHTTAFFFF